MKNKISVIIIAICLFALKGMDTLYYTYFDKYSPIYKTNDIQINTEIKEISSLPANSNIKLMNEFSLSEFNEFDFDRLKRVPGIGPATAKKIIDYRSKKGKLKKIEDLLNIKGIGEKRLIEIKNRLKD